MAIAYHLIWTAYGFWLANDIRGSTSRILRNDVLRELGEIHFGRKRVQPRSFQVREFFARAQRVMEHPVIEFGVPDVAAIGSAFGQIIRGRRYTCYACAIMPDHVHLVIRKHNDGAERMIAELHRASHLRLRELGLRDMDHRVWGGRGWKVYLEDADDIRRTVNYVEDNPVKVRQPKQVWDFVNGYDGWTGTRVRVVNSRRSNG